MKINGLSQSQNSSLKTKRTLSRRKSDLEGFILEILSIHWRWKWKIIPFTSNLFDKGTTKEAGMMKIIALAHVSSAWEKSVVTCIPNKTLCTTKKSQIKT